MKFCKAEIIQELDWTKTINTVNSSLPKGAWVFRALEALSPDKLTHGTDNVVENVDVSIPSSFDTTWESRSWTASAPKRWRYEAWMLREFKRGLFIPQHASGACRLS
jgi:hypothetical protein